MGTIHFPGGTLVFETHKDDTLPRTCGSAKQPFGPAFGESSSIRDDFEGSMKRIREAHRLGVLPPTCSPQCQRKLGLELHEAPIKNKIDLQINLTLDAGVPLMWAASFVLVLVIIVWLVRLYRKALSARQTTVRQLEVLRVELYAARRKNVQLEAASRRLADETLRWQENLGRAELAYVELSNQYQDVKVRLDEERSRRVQLQQERRTLLNGVDESKDSLGLELQKIRNACRDLSASYDKQKAGHLDKAIERLRKEAARSHDLERRLESAREELTELRPQNVNPTTATPVPITDERARRLQDFKDAVYATVFSNVRGYDSVMRIFDAGIDGEQEANMVGFASFAAFLQSPAMSERVSVHQGLSDATAYSAIPNASNVHLRMEQWESAISKQENAAKNYRRQLESALSEVRRLNAAVAAHREEKAQLMMNARQQAGGRKFECPICWDAIPDVTFLRTDGRPCGHVACEACAIRQEFCHSCRWVVNGVVRLYLTNNV
ncbi:hypothetical protein AAVH_22763 [Aphelenchoides avenae]|nr:hypothetical protein AAVH_22763 [Aphelenchus avenae]